MGLLSNPNNPDIVWAVADIGVPLLCLQADGPSLSAGLACTEPEDLQFRYIMDPSMPGEEHFALFNREPAEGAKILVEAPYDSFIKPVIDAHQEGGPWVLCFQYVSQDTRISRIWLVEGPEITPQPTLDRWLVQVV